MKISFISYGLVMLLALTSSASAERHTPPAKPKVPPQIGKEYPEDKDKDRIEDALKEKSDKAKTAKELDTLIDVQLVFTEQITQEQIDTFEKHGGVIDYIYQSVSYGWNGHIPLHKVQALPHLLGDAMVLVEEAKKMKTHMMRATQTGRVRPVWANGFAGSSSGYNGSTNITIGIIDTGTDTNHMDLTNRCVYSKDQTGGNSLQDIVQHGTHVTGIATGTGASSGSAAGTIYFTLENSHAGASNENWAAPIDINGASNMVWTMGAKWLGASGAKATIGQFIGTAGTFGFVDFPGYTNYGTSPLTFTNSGINSSSSSTLLFSPALKSTTSTSVSNYFVTNSITGFPTVGDGFNRFSGVAPDCKYASEKVFTDDGSNSSSWTQAAVDDFVSVASANKIKIINMSLGSVGTPGLTTTLRQKVNTAVNNGLIVVVSAGNDGNNTASAGAREIDDPGRAAQAITVGAVDAVNKVTYYTSIGFTSPGSTSGQEEDYKPDLVAPGGSAYYGYILAPDSGSGDGTSFSDQKTNDYTLEQGTSMSAPFAAGCAALVIDAMESKGYVWSYANNTYPNLVKMLLSATATEVNANRESGSYNPTLDRTASGTANYPAGKDQYEGYGMINPDAAVEAVALSITNGITETATLGTNATDRRAWARKVAITNKPTVISVTVPSSGDFDVYLYSGTSGTYGKPVILKSSTAAATDTDEFIYYAPSSSTETNYLVVKRISGSGQFSLIVTNTSNDIFTNAYTITGTSGNTTGTNNNFTVEASEPSHGGSSHSAWYNWTCTTNGIAAFAVSTGVVKLYTGSAVGSLTAVTMDYTGGSSNTFNVISNTTYRVAVDPASGTGGSFTLAWSFPTITNDRFVNAFPLSGGFGSTNGVNTTFTVETGEPSHGSSGKSAWYSWTAGYTGKAQFNTTLGLVKLYTGSTVSNLTAVSSQFSGTSSNNFAVTADTTYWVAVDSTGGSYTLSWSYTAVPRDYLTNSTLISLPVTSDPASPYPVSFTLASGPGTIKKVTTTVRGLTASNFGGPKILLVGPANQKIILKGSIGASQSVTNAYLTFDDDMVTKIDNFTSASGTYHPTDSLTTSFSLTSPAPSRPYSTNLSDFIGDDAAGTWSFYVDNSSTLTAIGSITNWELNITFSVDASLSINTNATNFTKTGPAANLTTTAAITDPNVWNFSNGSLTLEVTNNAATEDRLIISSQGSSAGQINVSGTVVSYGGTNFGYYTGGSDGSTPLVVYFTNSFATFSAVQQLITCLAYTNTSTTPSTLTRSVEFTLDDGNNVSVTASKSIGVIVLSAAPVATINTTNLNYTENQAATNITTTATVSDSDSTDFDAGSLSISFTANGAAEDRLTLLHQGTGAGQIGVSGTVVSYGGTNFGYYAGGTSGSTPLVVYFTNSYAKPASVQQLITRVAYTNTSDNPSTTNRTVQFSLSDGDGGSATVSKTIVITAVNDVPTLTSITTLTNAVEDVAFTISYSTLAAAADEADLDSANISFRIESVTSAGTLTTNGSPVVVGSTALGSGGSLVWTPATNTSGSGIVAFTVKAYDGVAASATAIQVKIDVSATNDAPTLTAITTLTGAAEDVPLTISYDTLAAAANEADVEGGAISFRVEAINNGTLTLTNGTNVTIGSTLLATNGSWIWTPSANTNGTVNAFTVKAWDGALASASAVQVSANVAAVNDAPTVTNITTLATATEDVPFTISYTALAAAADETDVDGDAISFRVEAISSGTLMLTNGTSVTPGSTLLSSGENWIWTPATNASGANVNAFTVKAWDGTLASTNTVQVKVNVTATNDAPTLTLDASTVTYTENDGPTIISTNTVVSDVDSTDFNGGTLKVQLNTANVDGADILMISSEGTNASQIGVSGTNITYGGLAIGYYNGSVASSNLMTITFNTAAATPAAAQRLISRIAFTNSQDNPFPGNKGVSFILADGDGGSVSATKTITFIAVNDLPTISTITNLTGAIEDTAFTITHTNLANAADDADVESSYRGFRIESVSSGTLTLNGSPVVPTITTFYPPQSVVWTPATNANGLVAAFTVKVSDSVAVSTNTVQVYVNVAAVNDAPTLTSVSTLLSAWQDTAFGLSYDTLAAASDEADVESPVSFRIEGLTSGTLTKNGTNVVTGSTLLSTNESLIWTPASGVTGLAVGAFTVRAYDGSLASANAVQVNVRVTAITNTLTVTRESSTNGLGGVAEIPTGNNVLTFHADTIDAALGQTFALTNAGTGMIGLRITSLALFSQVEQTLSSNAVWKLTITEWQPSTNGNTMSKWTNGTDANSLAGFSAPSIALIASGAIAADASFSQSDYLKFTFDPGNAIFLQTNKAYAFYFSVGNGSNFNVRAGFNDVYPTGTAIQNAIGATSTQLPGYDMCFYLAGSAVSNYLVAPTLTTITTLTNAVEDTVFTISYTTLAAAADELDANGDAISFRIESLTSGTLKKNGTNIVVGSTLLSTNESLVWTPASNDNGTNVTAFTVSAWDGSQASAAVAVTVNVGAVADKPILTLTSDSTYIENDPGMFISPTATLTDADSPDFNGGSLKISGAAGGSDRLEISPEGNGAGQIGVSGSTVSYGGTPIGYYTGGVTNNSDLIISFTNSSATLAAVQQMVTRITFHNVIDSFGTFNRFITFTMDDGDGTNNTSGKYIFMTAVNDAPTLTTISTSTGATQNTPFTINYTNLTSAANEADVEGDTISFRIESVTSGTLTKNGNPITNGVSLLSTNETLVWTPATNASGSAVSAFVVSAWDGALASTNSVQVKVNVVGVNTAPVVANAIPTQTWAYGLLYSYTFAANVFTDANEGQTLTYSISGLPPGLSLVPAIPRTYNGTPTESGTYSVSLIATDDGNPALSATNTFSITIGPGALFVTPANVSRGYGSTNPTLSGTVFGIKNNDDISVAYSTTATTNSPAGNYPITAALTDPNNRLTNYSVTLGSGTLTITSTNATPTVAILTPASGDRINAGSTNIITATASDSDGSVTKVVFYEGTNKLGEVSSGAYSILWTNMFAGTFSLTAVATDDANATNTSSAVIVTVNPYLRSPQYDSHFSTIFYGAKDTNYTLEYSSDLSSWSTLTNLTITTGGITISDATNATGRYYRAHSN
ncbi:MAG: hypothetical protein JWM68_1190 [Verrucomicrobiales bacterium]|nr:hypothetical protein [Verrucomicrobiales bacterium]